jgi:hypothetical protein
MWRTARPGELELARTSHGICPECALESTSSLEREESKQ